MLLLTIILNQTIVVGPKSELAARRVYELCDRGQAFLKKIGFAPVSFVTAKAAFSARPYKEWEINQGDYQFTFEEPNGEIHLFVNALRRNQQYRAMLNRRVMSIRTKSEATARLMLYASKLSCPQDWKIEKLTMKIDGQVKDANSAGYFASFFSDATGKRRALINCDPLDGKLVIFAVER